MKELDSKFSNMTVDDMDDMISKLQKVKISKRDEDKIDSLIGSMESLSVGTKKQKRKMLVKGIQEKKRRTFAKKYKSLSGSKKVKLSNTEIDDIFKTMNSLKNQNGAGKKRKYKLF